jgi:CheY-like chemotaxis protein
MSRILSGKVRLEIQAVELASIVDAAMDAVRPSADVKDISLSAALVPGSGPVAGDPTRLHQVIWNLLTNAVKFTEPGGKVQVGLARVGAYIEVSVSDTGIGIAPEFLPHVFERFRQGDASTTRRYGGLGIGLSIVKQLAELHGGMVRAFSHGTGLGATFVLSLPAIAARADAPGASRFQPRPPMTDAEAVPPTPVELTGTEVLFVDDDEETRGLIALILEQLGARVTTVASVDDALDAIRHRCPDVLVSDIGLPGRDGYELIRVVREMEAPFADLPAVALTAFARAEDRRRALMAGFHQHLAKPVEPAELSAIIARLARRRASDARG